MEAVSECPALMEALAAAGPGPLFQRAHVLGVLHPPAGGRRDPANWYPSMKAAVDGIVDARVLEDDDHTRLLGPDMRLGEKRKGGQIVLVVRGLAPGDDPLGYRPR
jgi:crossover junction endodeoxyribonuclease RusA